MTKLLFLSGSARRESLNQKLAIKAAQIAKNAGAQKLILTHFSARYRDLDRFVAEAREIFPNVDVADDFKRFEFPIGNYS